LKNKAWKAESWEMERLFGKVASQTYPRLLSTKERIIKKSATSCLESIITGIFRRFWRNI
jgi:hypothetical protein